MRKLSFIPLLLAGLALVFAAAGPRVFGGIEAAAASEPISAGRCANTASFSADEMANREANILGYDIDHPSIDYGAVPTANPIALLQARMNSGEVSLTHEEGQGFLRSVLEALDISPASQILVYSRTSLQGTLIKAANPRAIYFNQEAYIAWIPGSKILEIVTVDCQKGTVYYAMDNGEHSPRKIERETNRCLVCHDTTGLGGGGVPLLVANSVPVTVEGLPLLPRIDGQIADSVPFEKRWAGWYVTGTHGTQTHLGNLQLHSQADLERADLAKGANLSSLAGLFDTSRYMTDKSDLIALMVFEHQTSVQNAIIAANFRIRTLLQRTEGDDGIETAWTDLPPATQQRLARLADPLVDALLFAKAAPLHGRIGGDSGFDAWFEARAVRDPQGRSLRDLELETRLFRYPVSYLVHSDAFDGLPRSVREYVYERISQVLRGEDASDKFAAQSAADRRAALDILRATKPDFAKVDSARGPA